MPKRFLTTKAPSRRDVMAGAAAATLFHIVPSHCLGLQGQTPPSDVVNLGHIGIGGRGKGFLRPIANVGKEQMASANLGGDGTRRATPAKSIALCDVDTGNLDAAATAVGAGAKTFRDFRRLLEDKDVDAVVIASPDHWHALQTILTCQAGKDVYCEKPACNTVEEGRAMVEATDRYARVVQIGSQGRSQMAAYHAKSYINNGQIGKIREVLC
jgi:predicted dehydrogenase